MATLLLLTGAAAAPVSAQTRPEVEIDRSAIDRLGPASGGAGAPGLKLLPPGAERHKANHPKKKKAKAKAKQKAPAKPAKTQAAKPAPAQAAKPAAAAVIPPAPALPPVTPPPAPPGQKRRAATPEPAPAPVPVPIGPAKSVFFMPQAAELPEEAKPNLNTLAQDLTADAHIFVELRAYAGANTDTAESYASESRRLSLSRALAIRGYLATMGVSPKRIDVRPMGNRSDPAQSPDRVDIILTRH